jgi:hypothetical protein
MAGAGGGVAWVTEASRGVGRGAAVALGQAGWVVYVTARSCAAARTGHLPGPLTVSYTPTVRNSSDCPSGTSSCGRKNPNLPRPAGLPAGPGVAAKVRRHAR